MALNSAYGSCHCPHDGHAIGWAVDRNGWPRGSYVASWAAWRTDDTEPFSSCFPQPDAERPWTLTSECSLAS